MQFNLNVEAAKKTGGYIESKGAYTGVFTEAWVIKSKKGVDGIHLAFTDVSGATAGHLDIYTHKADGSELMGYRMVNQIMACLGLRSMSPVETTVEIYDYDEGKKIPVTKQSFNVLLNKPIGLILRNEPYMGKDGPRDSMKIVMPFNAKSRKSAREILDQVPEATDVINVMATLKDKDYPVMASQPFTNSENPGFGINGGVDITGDILFLGDL